MDVACIVSVSFLFFGLTTSQQTQYTEVDTKLGSVRGYTETVLDIGTVKAFLGIPFGKAPVGDLRFQRPQPYGNWMGTWNATSFPPACPQLIDTSLNGFEGVTQWNPNTNISEDCLYLNIWTPDGSPPSGSAGRPVMVWIYGGGFSSGTSTLDWYDGRIMAAKGDVVVVSMQYRIGVIGFLSLGTEKAPGNAGLLDQHLALKWVRDNIGDYGGDPNQITLFGESAGAASVSMHLVSPLSQGLFQRAILESSTALCPWATDSQATTQARSLAIAKEVGCTDSSTSAVLECLLKVPHAKLTDTMWALAYTDTSVLSTPVNPTVDGYFFPKHPFEIIADGNIKKTSILLGVNRDEGAYFLPFTLPRLYNHTWQSVDSEEKYLQGVTKMFKLKDKTIADVVAFEYKQPYDFRDLTDYTTKLSDIFGDFSFICPVINFAKTYAKMNEDVYFYQFTHQTSVSPWPKWMGVLHGYEIDTVFGKPLNGSLGYTAAEKELSTRVLAHWTNFAKTGNPIDKSTMSYQWPLYKLDTRSVLILNTTNPPVVRHGLKDRKCAFWSQLYPKLNFSQGGDGGGNSNGNGPCINGGDQLTPGATLVLYVAMLGLFAQLALNRGF